jgi:hypothetical protein
MTWLDAVSSGQSKNKNETGSHKSRNVLQGAIKGSYQPLVNFLITMQAILSSSTNIHSEL